MHEAIHRYLRMLCVKYKGAESLSLITTDTASDTASDVNRYSNTASALSKLKTKHTHIRTYSIAPWPQGKFPMDKDHTASIVRSTYVHGV